MLGFGGVDNLSIGKNYLKSGDTVNSQYVGVVEGAEAPWSC